MFLIKKILKLVPMFPNTIYISYISFIYWGCTTNNAIRSYCMLYGVLVYNVKPSAVEHFKQSICRVNISASERTIQWSESVYGHSVILPKFL